MYLNLLGYYGARTHLVRYSSEQVKHLQRVQVLMYCLTEVDSQFFLGSHSILKAGFPPVHFIRRLFGSKFIVYDF